MAETHPHALNSTLRETIAEHLFVGDLLRRLWQRGIYDVEILRSEFDAGGYDLVLSYRNIVRHIQLKTIIATGRAVEVKVSIKLAQRPSGCVVWIILDEALEMSGFLWFGGEPGKPLPAILDFKTARHTKANSEGHKAERLNHRIVQRRHFEAVATLDGLILRLLGDLSESSTAQNRLPP
jgi:hypothetical protein